MVEAAEAIDQFESCPEAPLRGVLVEEDTLARLRTEHLIEEVADMALRSEVAYDPGERDNGDIGYDTLFQALWFAARGDMKALAYVRANASTHIYESLMKSGVVFDIELHRDSQGYLIQHGQHLEDVNRNALRWAAHGPEMKGRVEQETYNSYLAARLARRGLLENQMLVIVSPYPTDPNMTDDEARRIGFFPDTMSCVIQTITMRGGRLVQEVAFVAGAAELGAERHDMSAIAGLFRELGMPFTATIAPDVLARPFLVSNRATVIDLVKMYDRHAGGTFYGKRLPPQDYATHRAACRARLAEFDPLVDTTVQDLLAGVNDMQHPLDAIHALHDLAQERMVTWALHDQSVDEQAFGPEAAHHIRDARLAWEIGDMERFQRAESRAQATAITGSCPIEELKRRQGANGETTDGESAEGRDGDLPTTIRCIKCHQFVPSAKVVQMHNGKEKSWKCPKCTYEIDVCTQKELHHSLADKPNKADEPLKPPFTLMPLLAMAL